MRSKPRPAEELAPIAVAAVEALGQSACAVVAVVATAVAASLLLRMRPPTTETNSRHFTKIFQNKDSFSSALQGDPSFSEIYCLLA